MVKPRDVRCPDCDRLLGVEQGGETVIRRGDRVQATIREGQVNCTRCGVSVKLDRPSGAVVFRSTG